MPECSLNCTLLSPINVSNFNPYLTEQTTDSDDSDNEDDIKTVDDEDDGWESGASGPSFLEDLPGGSSSVSEGEEPDLAPLRNGTYILAEHEQQIENMEGKDLESETFIFENEELTEELQGESSVSQQNSSEDSNCDSNCNTDLVTAVLCSRNKIALALAGITQKNTWRSSNKRLPRLRSKNGKKFCSTGQTDKESCPKSKTSKECSSTIKTDRESYLTRLKIAENNTKKRSSVQCQEPVKVNVTKRLILEWDNKDSNVLNSERCQPLCPSEDRPRPCVRRRSIKITSSSFKLKTKSPPKTLKLKTDDFDKFEVRSSPVKRKSTTLCKLIGSSDGQVSNVEGGSIDSLITSSPSKALGRLFSNRNNLLLQSPASLTQPSRSRKTLRRRSLQLLRVNKDEFPTDSDSAVKRKRECLEYRRSPPRKCQACKGAFLGEGNEFHDNFSPTVKHISRDSSQDTAVATNSSKKSVICWPGTESKHVMTCENGMAKSNLGPRPVSSSQQKLKALLEGSEPVMEKLKVCEDKLESSPVAIKSRRDHKLLFSKNIDVFISNKSRMPPLIDKALEQKCESYPSEVKNRGVQRLSSTKANGGVSGNSENSVVSEKNSSAGRDRVLGTRKNNDKDNSVNKVDDGALNCKRKVNSPFYILTNKEHLSTDRPATSLHRKDLVSKQKGARTAKLCASSPSRRTRNNIVLSGDDGSNSPPLIRTPIRKRTARESVAIDTPDSLPRKQPKRSSPMSTCIEQGPSSFLSSQSLHWYGRESTPIKGKKIKRLRIEGLSSQNMKLLSPIRRPVTAACDSVQGAFTSPCKGLGSCEKSFCFECC